MRNFLSVIMLFQTYFCFCQDVRVNGYLRTNGTYVQSHHRTAPDNTINNNFSTIGNVNPYTGKPGYIQPSYENLPISLPSAKEYESSSNIKFSDSKPISYTKIPANKSTNVQSNPSYSGEYITLKTKLIMWDSPYLPSANPIGEVNSLTVLVLERTNNVFYKIRSGNKVGYIQIKS